MRLNSITVLLCSAWIASAAAPYTPSDLKLRSSFEFATDASIPPSSVFNPRFFDGNVYLSQINPGSEGFGRYPSGSSVATLIVDNRGVSSLEHRMVAPFRGANSALYLLGSSSGQVSPGTFSRYNFDGSGRVEVPAPGTSRAEGFDWVDDNTIIYTDYASGNRTRLYLADVAAEPFGITANTAWNANGYITTSVSTRIRNVRVGSKYPGYAYYGDNGNNNSPRFYAVNLATGAETLLGNAGALTGSGSFGIWTVLERDGYLYVQTTDNGIQVYPMTSATTIGPILATYSKADLDAVTSYTGQYYGLDITADGRLWVLGASGGRAYEFGPPVLKPYAPEQLNLRSVMELATDAALTPSSTFNPRFFDDEVYITQINPGAEGFGRYPSGQVSPTLAVDNHGTAALEHRMVAPFRGGLSRTYILGSSSGQVSPGVFSRYNFDGTGRVQAAAPGTSRAEGFDWVDENTIIYTDYASGARNRLHLADVTAEPFTVTPNPAWNANGYITTSASTRIRNVRVGDVYPGYAYYGDAGNNDSPKFYAVNLATGAETLLGNAGPLTGTGSFGIWTVLERGGYLYVQTTDNGIQVYPMIDATTAGPIYATYQASDLNLLTGYSGQYYGLDVSSDGRRLVLGAAGGNVYEIGPPQIAIKRVGTETILSWPAILSPMVVQSSSGFTGFTDLEPQPAVQPSGKLNTVTLSAGPVNTFFRLRKAP